MQAEHISIATICLHGAQDGSLSFPEIIGRLAGAGFDGYLVDYRRNVQTYYLPDGDSVVLDMQGAKHQVAVAFDGAEILRLIRWAQTAAPDYSYAAFSTGACAAGCAGYLVSISGRRVLYFGRDGATHTEHFPD